MALAHLVSEAGPATGAAVASALGAAAKELSWVRQSLIDKGTLVAAGTELSFVVPGFASYVLAQERAGTMAGLLDASFPQGALEGPSAQALLEHWPPEWTRPDELGR